MCGIDGILWTIKKEVIREELKNYGQHIQDS